MPATPRPTSSLAWYRLGAVLFVGALAGLGYGEVRLFQAPAPESATQSPLPSPEASLPLATAQPATPAAAPSVVPASTSTPTPRASQVPAPVAAASTNALTLNGASAGSGPGSVLLLDVAGNITMQGGASFGRSLAVGGSLSLSGDILPTGPSQNLGSATNAFSTLYVNTLSAASSTIAGSASSTFTVDTAQTGNNTDTPSLRFYLGPSENTYAALQWNGPANRFDLLSRVSGTAADLKVADLVSGSATLQLPTSSDMLVGRATTDTLSNKTLVAPQVTGNLGLAGNLVPSGSRTVGTSSNKFLNGYFENLTVDNLVASGTGSNFTDPLSVTTTTGPQLVISYDISNYFSLGVASDGVTTLAAHGWAPAILFGSQVTANSLQSSGAGITGGSINSTPIGAGSRSSGAFTSLAANGGLAVTGASTIAGSLSGITGLTVASGGLTVTSGTVAVSSGNLTVSGLINGAAISGGTYSGTGLTPTGNYALGSASYALVLQGTSTGLYGAVPTTAQYGAVNIGSSAAAFDGLSAGHFAGVGSQGTELAVNAASGFTGSLIDLQTGGVSRLRLDYQGNLAVAGTISGTFIGTFSGSVADSSLTANVALLDRASQSFSGTLGITGAGTALSVTNDAHVGGALGVTGAVTASSVTASGLVQAATGVFTASVSAPQVIGTADLLLKANSGSVQNASQGISLAAVSGTATITVPATSLGAGGSFAIAPGDSTAAVRTAAAAVPAIGSTTNLTVSGGVTADLDSNTALLIHANGTNGSTSFTDSSLNALTLTSTGSQVSTVHKVFGGASDDVNGGYLYTSGAGSDFALPGDFTVDFWTRFSTLPSSAALFFSGKNQTPDVLFLTTLNDGTGLRLGRTAVAQDATANYAWVANTWYHVAVVRSGSTITFYVDGQSVGTGSSSFSYAAGDLSIGGDNGLPAFSFPGYLDEFRLSKGVARWTSNFTPPAAEYTGSTGAYSGTYTLGFQGALAGVAIDPLTTATSGVSISQVAAGGPVPGTVYVGSLATSVNPSGELAVTSVPAASASRSLLRLGSALSGGSAAGTYLGVNAVNGFAGNLADLQVNGSSRFKVDSAGNLVISGALTGLTGLTTVGTVQGGTLNATSSIRLGGTDITTAGTLANLAYLNQSTTFSAAGTALTVTHDAAVGGNLAVSGMVNGLTLASGTVTSGTWQGGTLAVGYGGTGATSFTSKGLLYGSGSSALAVTAAGTSGQVLLANASGVPTFVTLGGDATLAQDGTITLATVNASPGTYGDASHYPVVTVDAKGRVTSVSSQVVSGGGGGGTSTNNFGDGSDGNAHYTTDTALATTTGVNDTGIVVKQYNSLIIDSGVTVRASNRAQVMLIYVKGNATINGTLSMDALGAAAAAPSAQTITRFLSNPSQLGTFEPGGALTLSFAQAGAAGAAAAPNGPGSAGTNAGIGQTGGGGSGGDDSNSFFGGAGAAGNAFVGGSGGGAGNCDSSGTAGGANGGAGGDAGTCTTYTGNVIGAGAGNPPGTSNVGAFGTASAGTGGGGGTIILVVGGTLTVGPSGAISANGGDAPNVTASDTDGTGGRASSGGGAGGGAEIIMYAALGNSVAGSTTSQITFTNGGVMRALGGHAGVATSTRYVPNQGGAGGNGSVQATFVSP